MRDAHLKMSESSSEMIDPFLCLYGQDSNDTLNPFDIFRQLLQQPQPHIRRNLIVPAPTSMQFPSNVVANNLAQSPLVRSVDIFIILFDLE